MWTGSRNDVVAEVDGSCGGQWGGAAAVKSCATSGSNRVPGEEGEAQLKRARQGGHVKCVFETKATLSRVTSWFATD